MLPITITPEDDSGLCPVRAVLASVSGKWQSLILLSLEDGALRFSAVKRAIGDITQRVLTENLRSLERDGYLTRSVDAGPPVAVSYELTDLGRSLVEVYKPLVLWAAEHIGTVKDARARYDAAADGRAEKP
ncbi:MAG: helix-turn-helix domain-containing protein [Magnetovibrio sp.]|nr:helix-turn-helix domain-containing protein [Magnetovibrio sp.]